MTQEEFEKRYSASIYDFVIGVDCFLTKTLTSKNPRVDYHYALTQKDYNDILELFTKISQES